MELLRACYINNAEKVNELIKNGIDVNYKRGFRDTPLIAASTKGNKHIVEILLANGADVNLSDNMGYTSLMGAIVYKKYDICEILIKNGANINVYDFAGETPLNFAIESGNINLVKLLIQYGANINFKDKDLGKSPIETACCFKQKIIAELLISNGIEINNDLYYMMIKNGWVDLCLKIINNRAFEKRKHLLVAYDSYNW